MTFRPVCILSKRESRNDDAGSASKCERKKEEEEKEEANETFERSVTQRKSDDRSHDREQSITSIPQRSYHR